jgi:hypothetical protein
MMETTQRHGFTLEAGGGVHSAGVMQIDQLDRYHAIKRQLPRFEHLTVTALSDHTQ